MLSLVAGHHRACPSATLDKSITLFGFTYVSMFVSGCQHRILIRVFSNPLKMDSLNFLLYKCLNRF
jgi:hypothetical protein